MKRVFLVILMLSFLASIEMEAKKKPFGNGLYWDIKKGALIISGCGSMKSFEDPWKKNSYFDRFYKTPWYNETFERIIIEDGVTSIGAGAFRNCGAQSIVIPNSVTTIGDFAFNWCRSLQSVVIPNSVTTIGKYAFEHCDNLQSVIIPSTVTTIEERVFWDCTSLRSIEIPNSVTTIGNHAFHGCISLQSAVIPSTVTTIEEGAFWDCTSIRSIEISNSVTTIGDRAFLNCTSLRSIEIPNSVTTIGETAFQDCTGLESIKLSNSITVIEPWTFYKCASLRSVIIPNSITTIGSDAFRGCTSLQSIVIPNSVTKIGEAAFFECTGLQSIEIPNSVKSIGNQAFRGCNNLQYITAPDISDRYNCFTGNNAKLRKPITGPNNEGYYLCEGGLMDGNYRWIIPQGTYNDIFQCTANHLIVKKGSRYGLITFDGKEIVAPYLDNLESSGPGYLRYKLNGFWGVMNYTGKIIIDTDRRYTSIGDYVTLTKRFPYTMVGYKGECDFNGRQISKKRVTESQQVASASSAMFNKVKDLGTFDLKGNVKSCQWVLSGQIDNVLFPFGNVLLFTSQGKIANKSLIIKRDSIGRLSKISDNVYEVEYHYKNDGKLRATRRHNLEKPAAHYLTYMVYKNKQIKEARLLGGGLNGLVLAFESVTTNKLPAFESKNKQDYDEVYEYKYLKFDKVGNWTKRQFITKEFDLFLGEEYETTVTEERKILYY